MAIARFEPETRRVQLTGGATLIVSLPKDWTRIVNLKPGDEVLIIPQPDMSLLIVPKKMVKTPSLETNIEVTDELSNMDYLERILLSYYLSGYDIIRLNFSPGTLGLKKNIKDTVRRKLTGVEITEESRNAIVLQNLVNALDINLADVVNRLVKTMIGMLEDLKSTLETGDRSNATDIIERDNEIDKFYWLLNRQLRRILVSKHALSLSGIRDPRNIVEYALISKALERAADHVAKIAYEILHLGERYIANIPSEIRQRLSGLVARNISLLTSLGKAMVEEPSVRELNYIIDIVKKEFKSEVEGLLSEIGKLNLDPTVAASLRLIIDSIYRIAEYASDVAESLITLTAERLTT